MTKKQADLKLNMTFYGWIHLFSTKMQEAFESHAKDKGNCLPRLGQLEYYFNKLDIHKTKALMDNVNENEERMQHHLIACANYCMLMLRESVFRSGKIW